MTHDPDPIQLEHELRIGLQALVLPADEQFAYHTAACPACELVTEFMYPYEAYVSNFSQQLSLQQTAALGGVTGEIREMAAEDTVCFDRGVLDRPVWVRLRGLAADTLASFGWPVEAPIPYREISPGVFVRP